jgi:uncharacterized membrane protein YdbT with pleckstrin-like domain
MRTKLKENETLIIEVKKHWVVLVIPLVVSVCVIYYFFVPPQVSNTNSGLNKLINDALKYGTIFCIGYFIYVVLERRYNIWAVTNRRVIDECGIVTHKAKESPIEKINNVDIVQTIMGRMFGYGKLQIQTAATYGESWINFVERPKELQDAILKQIERGSAFEDKKKVEIPEPKETRETKECPFCAETILKKAKICRFCGRELPIAKEGNELSNPISEENLQSNEDKSFIEEDKEKIIEKFANPHLWKKNYSK